MTKINLPVNELKNALVGLGKIIGKRTTLPVLGAVYINRDQDGWTTLTGSDIDSFVTVRLEQPDNGAPGTVLVPYNDLVKVVKGCSSTDVITVEATSNDRAVLHYPIGNQQGEQHTGSFPAEEFPPIPRIEGRPEPVHDEVRRAIQEAMQCASSDETRVILQGAFLDVSQRSGHYVVATDGRHLYSSNTFNFHLKESILIPDHKFIGWKEFNNDGEWRMQVRPGVEKEHGLLQICSRRWSFIIRQLDGNYPNWRQVVPAPDSAKTHVEIPEDALEAVAKLISKIPDDDDTNHRLALKITGKKLFLCGKSRGSDNLVELEISEATVKGKEVTVWLNRLFLAKALRFGLNQIEIIDPLTPLRIVNQGRQMIVMPIRGDAPVRVTTSTRAPAPTTHPEEENGRDGVSPVNPQPETQPPPRVEERRTMPRTSSTHTNGNGTNGDTHQSGNAAANGKSTLETAIDQIDTIKGSYRQAVAALNELADTLKQVQREQKSTEKEVQSVRATLEKLHAVKI